MKNKAKSFVLKQKQDDGVIIYNDMIERFAKTNLICA